jgi:putative hydrolase of the HAD superfamily
MTRAIAAVGFDLDYTLWDQDQFPLSFFAAVAGELAARLQLPRARVEAALRGCLRRLTLHHPRLFGAALDELGATDPALEAELVADYRRHRPPLAPYPGALELLDWLGGQGYQRFLVTDGHGATQRYKVEALGLAARFEAMVFTDELPEAKPSPAPFLHAADRLGIEPTACAYVGDDPQRDFAGPRRLGFLTFGVATGPFANLPANPDQIPDHRLGTLDDLRGLL